MTMTTDTPTATTAMLRRLEVLRDVCIQIGCDKHEQVQMLVAACIDEGVDTGPEIIATLVKIGFKGSHVGIVLRTNLKRLWQRDGERFYTALPPLAQLTTPTPGFRRRHGAGSGRGFIIFFVFYPIR